MNIHDPLDISARLRELRLLKDGWLDGQGVAPSEEGLDWLSQAFDQHYPEDLPLPCLYPTEEGGVEAEWQFGSRGDSLEIELSSYSGEWHALDMEANTVSERTLNLDDAEDWKWLVEQIRQRHHDSKASNKSHAA